MLFRSVMGALGDVMAALGDVMAALHDVMAALEDVMYILKTLPDPPLDRAGQVQRLPNTIADRTLETRTRTLN